MALSDKAKAQVLSNAQYRRGANVALLRAYLEVMAQAGQPGTTDGAVVQDIQEKAAAALTNTGATIATGAGRYFGIFVVSPTAATEDVIVYIYDNTVIIGACTADAGKTGQDFTLGKNLVPGASFATSLVVKAFKKSDGTSTLDAGNLPDVSVLFGQ